MTKLAQEVVPREALAVPRPAGLAVVVLEPGHLLALLKGEQVRLELARPAREVLVQAPIQVRSATGAKPSKPTMVRGKAKES